MKKTFLNDINRVATTHFVLRHTLVNALKNIIINDAPAIKQFTGDSKTWYEYWTKTLDDKFYDMGTFVRLATEIEKGLKYYYISKKGYKNLSELKGDNSYWKNKNIFQQIMPWQKDGVIKLFKKELGYDLTSNPSFGKMQELMLLRHLYAHSSGIIDEGFIEKYKKLTGIELKADLSEDTYYFKPLDQLNDLITDSRSFVNYLPD